MLELCAQITCNGCGEVVAGSMRETGKELRSYLRERYGWVNRGAMDWCPDCKGDKRNMFSDEEWERATERARDGAEAERRALAAERFAELHAEGQDVASAVSRTARRMRT